MKKFKPTKFDVMVLGLTALFLLVTGLYFVVCNGAFCPLCQDYFISNGETYIWDTRGGYLEPLSVYRHCHSDGVSMLDIRTGMHSECSSTARTGIVRFADDPGPHPLYCLRHRPDQSLGRFQMLDQNQDYTVVWGLREGYPVPTGCFLQK